MVFISINFLIFFPSLVILFFATPSKYRWLTLLIASYFFYINIKPVYALLTSGITISTFIFTKLIDNTRNELKKKSFMVINIVLILLPLFFFKYFGVINIGIIGLLESWHLRWPLPEIKLLLPVGISFYTFMAIGYTIDVYNEEVECEKNIGILALFISFFPLVLSGPIERAKNMLPQFNSPKDFDINSAAKGLKIMLWGYFMKLVVAGRVGMYIDPVFSTISDHNGSTLLVASLFYPFQVYADLGGYTLIAMGTANVMGLNVMPNFNRPFFATSMADFWRRWHMSLITWLTDYIYTPLSFAFRNFGDWGIVFALMITFLISGIWHGAAITFIVWGLLQGVFLSLEALTFDKKNSIETEFRLKSRIWYLILGSIVTFLLFTVSLVFVRADNLNDAIQIISKIFSSRGPIFIDYLTPFIYCIGGILMLILSDFRDEYFPSKFLFFENKHLLIRLMSYFVIIILILIVGVFDTGQFIYFKF
jgi:alginate O-acetyltransferase complex protein AlgI